MAHHKQGAVVQLVSMYRSFLVSSFGLFAARLWARHIHDRFRDAVAVIPSSDVPIFPDPDREVTRDFHFCAHRVHLPGSRRNRA